MARSLLRITCIIPILFVATFIFALLIMPTEMPITQSIPTMNSEVEYLEYATVPGYFQQDDPATNDTIFNYTASNFGLIERVYNGQAEDKQKTQWEKFDLEVARLNRECDELTQYKVLFYTAKDIIMSPKASMEEKTGIATGHYKMATRRLTGLMLY